MNLSGKIKLENKTFSSSGEYFVPTTDKQRYNIYSDAYFYLVLETYYDFFCVF
jgi:hypothetical protein